METSNFIEKLNRVDGVIYTIEEKVILKNDIYESALQHDNVNESTINVYTGSRLTGDRIETWALSTPSAMPWKKIIRINADVQEAYISYETTGDTVEAEDINNIQEAVLSTQMALNTAESNLETKKIDKTTVASDTLGLVKSGTDISVDSLGNVSVNDNSHYHIVGNLSDLTATADELNVLEGMTASTAELNYTKGLTGNIQTQLNAKAPLAGPVLTGTPKAPTASAGTNTTQIATTAFVQTAVSNHNTSTAAHSDLRELLLRLTTRLNTLADSDDTTLDQLSEIVSYIKSNRTLIENITTNKVNVSDIVDNLTSTAGNKPLSANQGKVLSDLISTLTAIVNMKVDGVKGNAESSYRTGNVNITPANIGLGNVPNVTTNNQTPTYTEASALAKLVSGEKLSTAFGKISKAVSDLISHIGDTIKHITSAERTNWTAAYTHSQSAHAPSNAEVNQNAFSNIIAGSTTISADSKTDTVTFAAGSNITLTPDAANDKITISSKDTVYTHPAYSTKSSGLYKVTIDSTGHVSAAAAVTKSDITALGIPSSDTNTHYTSKNVVGSSTAKSNTTAALTNGNVYLNSVENGAVTSSNKISGSGATTVTTDASGNIVISSTDTTYTTATTTANGLMSSADKAKLNGIANNANNYTHPTTAGNKHIPAGGSSGQILRWSADGTAVWGADSNTTYSTMTGATTSAAGKVGLVPAPAAGKQTSFLRGDGTWVVPTDTTYTTATTTANGLMSSADKTKLNGIAAGANKTTVDSSLSSTSTNPVQNKVINSALSGKVGKGCTWNELMGV